MHTITVDDERFAVNALLRLLRQIDPNGTHEGVTYSSDFFALLSKRYFDVAFVDVDLQDTDGITITKRLAEEYPDLNVIIYTGHPQYKADAMDVYASACLIKPVDERDLRNALAHLRNQVKTIRVQCFGYFEVFAGDTPLKFKRKDSKEVFAYLIDKRGAAVPIDELRCLLWGEEEDTAQKKNYIRNIISDIRSTLGQYGVQDVIVNDPGAYAVDASKLSCDYYDFLAGKEVRAALTGAYMEQYSDWAAETKAKIFRKFPKNL